MFMKKHNKNSIEKPNPSKAEFDAFYQKPNPWKFDGNFNDLVRQEILKVIFKNKRYKNGVDIACGEGFMTARLNFIENKVGIDIFQSTAERHDDEEEQRTSIVLGRRLRVARIQSDEHLERRRANHSEVRRRKQQQQRRGRGRGIRYKNEEGGKI